MRLFEYYFLVETHLHKLFCPAKSKMQPPKTQHFLQMLASHNTSVAGKANPLATVLKYYLLAVIQHCQINLYVIQTEFSLNFQNYMLRKCCVNCQSLVQFCRLILWYMVYSKQFSWLKVSLKLSFT